MPITIKYYKQKFDIPDQLFSDQQPVDIEDLLNLIRKSKLAESCPQFFTLHYVDKDGDQISVLNTQDFNNFVGEIGSNFCNKTLNLVKAKVGIDTLSLFKVESKSLDQLMQEQMERQLALSVTKFEKEMHEKVRLIVEQETKEFLSQSQFQKQEKQLPKPKSDKLPQISDFIKPQVEKLQEIQDQLSDLNDTKKFTELWDNFNNIYKELKQNLKCHIKEVQSQYKQDQKNKLVTEKLEKKALRDSKMAQPKKEVIVKLYENNDASVPLECQKPWKKTNKAKFNPISESPKIEKREAQLSKVQIINPVENLTTVVEKESQQQIQEVPQKIVKVEEPIVQELSKQLPVEVSNQDSKGSKQPKSILDRSQAIAQMFGFDFSVVTALIRANPSFSDDDIANQLFDQFK